MAEQLKDFSFNGTKAKDYPWDKWLNGKPWKLKQGTDYRMSTINMRSAIYSAAKRRGGKARCSVPDDGTLVIQFFKTEE